MFPAVDDLLPIAQVLKSYGTQGEVLISFLAAMPDDIDLNEPVFLIPEGLPVPFFIEDLQFRGTSKALVKFEDIDSMKEAEEITNQKIYYPAHMCYSEESDSLLGYTLYNQSGEKVGIITQVHDFSGNTCLEVNGTLIPLHPDLIIKHQKKGRKITINIPEGL